MVGLEMKSKKEKKNKKKKKKNKKKTEFIAIGIFLLVLLALFLFLNWLSPMLLWDENVYLGNARSHLGISNFTEDFRFPLLEYIISFSWLFGESIFIARFVIILFSLASAFFIYLISKRFFSKQLSFLLSILFVLCPLFLFWGFRVYADIPAVFFIILSFYFLLKSDESKRKNIFIALAGFIAALAFLARFPLALFAFSVGVCFVFKKRWKDLGIFVLFFLIPLIPWLVYNWLIYKNPIWDFYEQFSVLKEWTTLQPIINQIYNLFAAVGFMIPFLFILGLYSLIYLIIKNKNKKGWYFLIVFYSIVSFVYYLFFVRLKLARYYLSFLPFIYIVAFHGLLWIKNYKDKILKIVFILVILSLLVNSFVIVGNSIQDSYQKIDCQKNNAIMKSIDCLKEQGASSDSVILSNIWPWYGYHLNSKVASLWTEDIDYLMDFYEPDYIIYNEIGGTYFNKTILDNHQGLIFEKQIVDDCDNIILIYSSQKS